MKFIKRKLAESDRRKRPRHERLIIAATLVVGVLWLVSIFNPIRAESLGWALDIREGAAYVGTEDASQLVANDLLQMLSFFDRQFYLESTAGTWLPSMSRRRPWVYVQAPSWLILLALSSVLFLPPALLSAHRRRKNRCIGCGYPRDEQLERCPECGRLGSEPSSGFWILAWRAYRWPLACISVNVAITLVAIAVLN